MGLALGCANSSLWYNVHNYEGLLLLCSSLSHELETTSFSGSDCTKSEQFTAETIVFPTCSCSLAIHLSNLLEGLFWENSHYSNEWVSYVKVSTWKITSTTSWVISHGCRRDALNLARDGEGQRHSKTSDEPLGEKKTTTTAVWAMVGSRSDPFVITVNRKSTGHSSVLRNVSKTVRPEVSKLHYLCSCSVTMLQAVGKLCFRLRGVIWTPPFVRSGSRKRRTTPRL
ncbi:hypothetical protein QOT17_001247 [Balamuthia mandrillaris]